MSVSSLLDSNKCGKRLKVLPGDSTLAAVSAGSGSDVTIFKSDPSALQQVKTLSIYCGVSIYYAIIKRHCDYWRPNYA